MHEALLHAHRTGDVDLWMSVEADTILSANGGEVSTSASSDRRPGRAAYLGSTVFDVYEDTRPPLVAVSEEGGLGWVVAQVRVRGMRTHANGDSESIDDLWAWVELYRRVEGDWKMVGNVSNRRPPDPDAPDAG